jgi:hypothetical protein
MKPTPAKTIAASGANAPVAAVDQALQLSTVEMQQEIERYLLENPDAGAR